MGMIDNQYRTDLTSQQPNNFEKQANTLKRKSSPFS